MDRLINARSRKTCLIFCHNFIETYVFAVNADLFFGTPIAPGTIKRIVSKELSTFPGKTVRQKNELFEIFERTFEKIMAIAG